MAAVLAPETSAVPETGCKRSSTAGTARAYPARPPGLDVDGIPLITVGHRCVGALWLPEGSNNGLDGLPLLVVQLMAAHHERLSMICSPRVRALLSDRVRHRSAGGSARSRRLTPFGSAALIVSPRRVSSWLLPRSERPPANDPNHGGGHSPTDRPAGQPNAVSLRPTGPQSDPAPDDLGIRAGGHRSCPVRRRPGGVRPHPPSASPRRTAPDMRVVVREISAHPRRKHLTTRHTRVLAQVRAVELRGLESLTL